MLDLILNFTYNDLRCDSGLESEFGISAADNGRLTFAYTEKGNRLRVYCLKLLILDILPNKIPIIRGINIRLFWYRF